MLAVRRGLRHAPDDPELLGMLREVEKSMERGKAGQHAVQAQVRAGLDRLRATGSVLMIAAHPDDENTAVLAYFARGRHFRTGYLSLTRGEGEQL